MKFDIVVIGSGADCYVAAIRAAQLGLKATSWSASTSAESASIKGCIPTQALLRSAEVFAVMRHANDCGVAADNVRFDAESLIERPREITDRLFKKNTVEVIWETPR
jgi:dihydrolipoamide dehydrogenase